jgi:peptidoglycan/LPS O-acetylase OafA/YrhL
MRYLSEVSDSRENNYDLIRFICASLVIFSHSFLSGSTEPLGYISKGFIDFGNLAVRVFFVISGFLVTQSFLRRRHLFSFLEARCLRIFPGLIVAVIFSIVVAASVSTLGISTFFHRREVYSFFLHNVSLIHIRFTLPGVFENNPNKGVNGALWTLPTEFQMYLLVAFTGLLGILSKRPLANLGILVLALITFHSDNGYMQVGAYPEILIFSFAVGAALFLNRKEIPLSLPLAITLSIATISLKQFSCFGILFQIILAYWVFVIAYHPKLKFHHFAKYGDFSYGLYVYGWPIEQLASMSPDRTQWKTFLIAYPVSLLLAFLSWHLIEKRAITLKNRFRFFIPIRASNYKI